MTARPSSAPDLRPTSFRVIPVPGHGAEDVLVCRGDDGYDVGFTGTETGDIFRISLHDDRMERVANTGGRPLGIERLPDGRLLVCDARKGLLAVGPGDGRVEVLAEDDGDRRFTLCDNAAVSGDGTIYFSDSSAVHGLDKWRADLLELTRTGRLLQRTPDGVVRTLVDDLAFANGVALAEDESFVVVAETATGTLVRYWLSGPQRGTSSVFADDLVGYPDNLSLGSDGLIWVALASPRDAVLEWVQRRPLWLRRAATRMPEFAQPAPRRTVHVQAYDRTGRLVHDLDVDRRVHQDRFHMVTGVREHGGRLWLGSFQEAAVAVLDL